MTSAIKVLRNEQAKWLVTGVAGFIGSNLLEELLSCSQKVVGMDNFETGFEKNLEDVKTLVPKEKWKNFSLIKGDIRDIDTCFQVCDGVDYVLHQAALGSVPRSIKNPIQTNDVNVNGFLNILLASRDKNVKKVVFASSSSVYGDHQKLPKVEGIEGKLLSPYAASKHINEIYADIFAKNFGIKVVGLRYFNVFGKRQNPKGPYSAVIPKWVNTLSNHGLVEIFGDGETSRDFCHINNVVSANILAALNSSNEAQNKVYNIAVGERTTLNELFGLISKLIQEKNRKKVKKPKYRDFRVGDVRHSHANISRAKKLLNYRPLVGVREGLEQYIDWYFAK